MNLFYSSITSILIVGAIWFVALLQPVAAVANSFDPIKDIAQAEKFGAEREAQTAAAVKKESNKVKSVKTQAFTGRDFSTIEVIGNTQTAMLSSLDTLLAAFNNNEAVNTKLFQQPSKVYIYYRDFSSAYDSATITVGYNKAELVGANKGVTLPKIKFEPLLEKGEYTNSEIVNGWQKINYGQKPQAVLEIHYLNKDGSIGKNELLVSYEQGA